MKSAILNMNSKVQKNVLKGLKKINDILRQSEYPEDQLDQFELAQGFTILFNIIGKNKQNKIVFEGLNILNYISELNKNTRSELLDRFESQNILLIKVKDNEMIKNMKKLLTEKVKSSPI